MFVERVFGLVFVCSRLRCGGERVFGCVPVFAVFGGCFTVVFGSVRLPLLILYCVRLNACSRVRGRAKICLLNITVTIIIRCISMLPDFSGTPEKRTLYCTAFWREVLKAEGEAFLVVKCLVKRV